MTLFNLLSLDDRDIDFVTTVVRDWCEKHKVAIDSDRGHAAMTAAVNRVMAGEKTPEALHEAITSRIHIEQYKNPTV